MNVIGYKCFNPGIINRYGKKFEIGKIYFAQGNIRFGNFGNGFHLCKNMEDTFRYFDAMEQEVSICLVIGSGEMVSYFDEYYEYYDMYAVQRLKLLKELSRDEIIEYGLHLDTNRVRRFISGYKLQSRELIEFKKKFKNDLEVLNTIAYYQERELDAFVKKRGVYHG